MRSAGHIGQLHTLDTAGELPFLTSNPRFAYAVVATHNMVGAAETARYSYVDGKTDVTWEVGERVDTAVWITVFIVLIALINLFPVKVG